jgi:hypothetical protein
MSITCLLSELERRRIRPIFRAGTIRLVGRASAITPDLVDSVRAVKPSLLAVLAELSHSVREIKTLAEMFKSY